MQVEGKGPSGKGFGRKTWVNMMAEAVRQIECESCDHELVHGVACDGQYEECPYMRRKAFRASSTRVPRLYLLEVADMALPGEFDAVRSES